jgi:hypothetical protein
VSTSVTTSELCVFVARHGISVISCFETIPRRSHKQKQQGFIPNDRKAFRLCIAREDCDKLLNSDIWPAHVTVSRWIFTRKEQSSGGDVMEHGDDAAADPEDVTHREWAAALQRAVSEAEARRGVDYGTSTDPDVTPAEQGASTSHNNDGVTQQL